MGFGVLGNKYYVSSPDGIDLIRIVKEKKSGELTAARGNEKFKVSLDKLKENGYRRLKPSGMISFAKVKVGTDPKTGYPVDDVIVSVFRQSELETNNHTPYLVCRQNINDIFYQYMGHADDQYVGLSCTRDSFPEMNIDFSAMMLCEDIYEDEVTNIHIYLQDTLEEILSMVKVSIYDKVLEELRKDYIKTTIEFYQAQHKPIPQAIQFDPVTKPPLMGYCSTLKDLLYVNNFAYDLNTTFNIVPVTFKLDYDENGNLCPEHTAILENIVQKKISKTAVVDYGHDVNLKEINMSYQLIRDATTKVFVVGYLPDGEYVETDPEVLKIKEDMMEYLACTTTKYKYLF